MMYALGLFFITCFWAAVLYTVVQCVRTVWLQAKYRPLPSPDGLAEHIAKTYDMPTVVFCYEITMRDPSAVYSVAKETMPVIRTRRAMAKWWYKACLEVSLQNKSGRHMGPYRGDQWMH